MVLSEKRRVIFIRDFQRICRGKTTFEKAGVVLDLRPEDTCHDLGFNHGHICVATVRISKVYLVLARVHVRLEAHGFYIFTFGPDLSVKAGFVRPSNDPSGRRGLSLKGCMQITDRRLYFTWEDSRRRQDIPLFEDAEVEELPPPTTLIGDLLEFEEPAIMWLMTAQHSQYSFTISTIG